jgi:hypothetical protein
MFRPGCLLLLCACSLTVVLEQPDCKSDPQCAELFGAGYRCGAAGFCTRDDPTGDPGDETDRPADDPTGDPGDDPTDSPGDVGPAPSPPTGLKGERDGGTLVLTWAASAGATGYDLVWETTPLAVAATGAVDNVTSPHLFAPLAARTYALHVIAKNKGGRSTPSNSVSFAISPPPPSGLQASVQGAQVTLAWDDVAEASYRVFHDTQPLAVLPTYDETDVPTKVGDYAHGTHYFGVQAVVRGYISDLATIEPVVVVLPPDAPAGLQATLGQDDVTVRWQMLAGHTYDLFIDGLRNTDVTSPYVHASPGYGVSHRYEVLPWRDDLQGPLAFVDLFVAVPIPYNLYFSANEGYIDLAWAASGADAYRVLYKSDGAFVELDGAVAESSFRHEGPELRAHDYKVQARYGEQWSEASASVSVAYPPLLTPPYNLQLQANNRRIDLSFDPVWRAEGYLVYRSETADVAGDAPRADITGTSYFEDELDDGKTYTYAVRAYAGDERSALSHSQSKAVIPAPPASFSTLPGDAKILLQWSAAAGATSYRLHWDDAPDGGFFEYADNVTSPYLHTDRESGQATYYRLFPVNGAGPGSHVEADATPSAGKVIVTQEAKIVLPAPESGAKLGWQVEVTDTYVFASAPYASRNSGEIVAAPVVGGRLGPATLVPRPADAGGEFGFTMAAAGTRVTANSKTGNGGNRRLFVLTGPSWTSMQVTQPSDCYSSASGSFGEIIDMDGDTLATIGRGAMGSTSRRECAFVFRVASGLSTLEKTVKTTNFAGTVNDVVLAGGALGVVQVTMDIDYNAGNAMSELVTTAYSAPNWSPLGSPCPLHSLGYGTMFGADLCAGAFGGAFTLQEYEGSWKTRINDPGVFGKIALAAAAASVGAANSHVSLYQKTAAGWQKTRGDIVSDDRQEGDSFAWNVAVHGDRIVVGAPLHDVGDAADSGAVYVFKIW